MAAATVFDCQDTATGLLANIIGLLVFLVSSAPESSAAEADDGAVVADVLAVGLGLLGADVTESKEIRMCGII